MLNTIYVFNSFPIIWVMTQGGPANSTDILVTYLYKLAFRLGKLGEAAAVSLLMFAILLIFTMIYVRLAMREQARMTPKLKRSIIAWLLLSPLLVVTIFPFAVMFMTAVKPRPEVLSPTWWPSEFRWSNFADMWVATGFGQALANSLYVSVIATVRRHPDLGAGRLCHVAVPLCRLGAFRQFLLVSQMISPIVLVLGLFRLMAAWGLIESTTALGSSTWPSTSPSPCGCCRAISTPSRAISRRPPGWRAPAAG